MDSEAALKAIVDANQYMTLATADEGGNPWASPVWFATHDYREFFWVSRPEARHSRNIAGRADVGIAIFDSGQAPGTGQGVYVSAVAEEVPENEVERGIAVFSSISEAKIGSAWEIEHVQPPAHLRLYRATAAEHFVLSSRDERVRVTIG
jgi:nitroimidazol reductase NimA-like FMN-containing flavoprotein (pyridoxamine 5'-phosphate oxidase superfamily)